MKARLLAQEENEELTDDSGEKRAADCQVHWWGSLHHLKIVVVNCDFVDCGW